MIYSIQYLKLCFCLNVLKLLAFAPIEHVRAIEVRVRQIRLLSLNIFELSWDIKDFGLKRYHPLRCAEKKMKLVEDSPKVQLQWRKWCSRA